MRCLGNAAVVACRTLRHDAGSPSFLLCSCGFGHGGPKTVGALLEIACSKELERPDAVADLAARLLGHTAPERRELRKMAVRPREPSTCRLSQAFGRLA